MSATKTYVCGGCQKTVTIPSNFKKIPNCWGCKKPMELEVHVIIIKNKGEKNEIRIKKR